MCISAKVLSGVNKAVSNSSAENSALIFKIGLKTYQQNKHLILLHNKLRKPRNTKISIKTGTLHQISKFQLTFKKLRIEANSHMDRILHRGNCSGSGSITNWVTILLHCLSCGGDGGGDSASLGGGRNFLFCFLCAATITASAAAAAWSLAAERRVQALAGLSLLTTLVSVLSLFWVSETIGICWSDMVGFESGSGVGSCGEESHKEIMWLH